MAGGGVGLFNARKAVLWKRAEYASSFVKEITSMPELVFVCRALEWNGGRLVVPESLRPLLPDQSCAIEHDPTVFQRALERDVWLEDMEVDPRLQIYRTATDTFLSWLGLIDNALRRNLFVADDVREVGYWVKLIEKTVFLQDFIDEYEYRPQTSRLNIAFLGFEAPSSPVRSMRGGFGASARGRSAGG